MKSFPLAVAAVAAGLVCAVGPGPAHAQTATNLKCKGCVGKKELGKNAVTSKTVRKNAISTKHIKSGAVSVAKLADAALPGAVSNESDYSGSSTVDTTSATSPVEVLSDTVVLPAKGYLQVSASWVSNLPFSANGECWVTRNNSRYTLENNIRSSNAAGSDAYVPGGVTAVFGNVSGGQHVLRLLCRKIGAIGYSVERASLTALFVPGAL